MEATPSYILGAGFSRAIGASMPTLAELQPAVLQDMGLPKEHLASFGDNLEQWMSYLSVQQPWLADQDNLRNRAAFADASLAVDKCIRMAENATLESVLPDWLSRLVLSWCEHGSSIISFNYDLLIERAAYQLRRTQTWADLYALPLDSRQPPGSSSMFSTALPDGPLFELFKLHGSINWAFAGIDAPVSDRVVLTENQGMWKANGRVGRKAGRYAALHDDLVPLIIPPTGSKSDFYSNRSLRAQWRQASSRLQTAKSLTIIGYSFPDTDLGARHFVANSLQPVPVTVVDYSEKAVSRIQDFLGPKFEVVGYTGENAVSNYVTGHCGHLVQWGVRREDDGGWRPYLSLDGRDQLESPPAFKNERADPEPAIDWITTRVDRLSEGLSNRSKHDWARDGARSWIGYIPSSDKTATP